MRSLLTVFLLSLFCVAQQPAAPPLPSPAEAGVLGDGDFDIFGGAAPADAEADPPSEGGAPKKKDNSQTAPNFFDFIPTMPKEIEVVSEGGTIYDSERKTLSFQDKVVIKGDNGLIIYADEAVIDNNADRVTARGNVSIFSGPLLYHGKEAVYYYKTKKIETKGLRANHEPFFIEADTFQTVEHEGREVQVAENAKITTDDYDDPGYWLKAKKVAIHSDDVVVFESLKVQVGDVTVFWLPYLVHSLDADLGYHFNVGYETHTGAFMKNRYGMHLGGRKNYETLRRENPTHLLSLYADVYTSRGLGLGLDLHDLNHRSNPQLGVYSIYWIYDFDQQIERTRVDRSDFEDQSRYLLEVRDRRDLGEILGGETWFDSRLTYLSDEFFLEDFYEARFRTDPEPDNTFSLSHVRERSVSSINTRFQLNSFYETDDRLPEFSYDFTRTRLWDSAFTYEGNSRLGFQRVSLSEFDRERLQNTVDNSNNVQRVEDATQLLDENGYFRGHTWHEVSAPLNVIRGVNITPRAGAGYTHYLSDDLGVDEGRSIGQVGLDLSAKFSKDYRGAKNSWLGIDGIGHRVQPYLNLSWTEVSTADLGDLQLVDTFTPITRPRPVNVGRISAIDELTDQFIIRGGIRQSILTKRDNAALEWLYLDTFIDFLPTESAGDNTFSNLYNELNFGLLPWMRLSLETQFPISESEDNFKEINLDSTFMLGKSTSFKVGFQFLENHPIVNDITQLNYDIFHRANDKWGFGMSHTWRLDQDVLTLQRYEFSRSVKSWVFSAGVFRRDFIVDSEWGVTFGLALRDFPEISLPISVGGDR